MEPWGFEPQIQPCHGRVIPFHYSPEGAVATLTAAGRVSSNVAGQKGGAVGGERSGKASLKTLRSEMSRSWIRAGASTLWPGVIRAEAV